MDANKPDRLNRSVLLMVAILGALLLVVGWYRYLSP